MERTTEDIIMEVIMERIDQLLVGDKKAEDRLCEEREKILKELDANVARKFEAFASSLFTESAEDYVRLYRAAFADGLRLAHKIF